MKRTLTALAVAALTLLAAPTVHATDDGWTCPPGTTHSYKIDNLSGGTFTVPPAPPGWTVLGVSIKAGPGHYDYPTAVSGDVIQVKADTGHAASHAHICKRQAPATTTTSTTSTTTTTTEVQPSTTTTTAPPSTTTAPTTSTPSTSSSVVATTSVPTTTTTIPPSSTSTPPSSSEPETPPSSAPSSVPSTSSTDVPDESPPPSTTSLPTPTPILPETGNGNLAWVALVTLLTGGFLVAGTRRRQTS